MRCFLHRPYNMEFVLGRGGHGQVYAAIDRSLGKLVTIKDVPDTWIAESEANMLRRMQRCPHVARYADDFVEEGRRCIVMEYVDGAMTVGAAHRERTIAECDLRRIVGSVVHGLEFFHERNVMFGDLKPDNLLLHPSGELQFIDFGCARELRYAGDTYDTFLGTPLYAAPEKFDKCFGKASDLWSLGVLMYVLICGHHPFVHQPQNIKSMDAFEVELKSTPLTFHHPVWDEVSEDLRELLGGLLQKDPGERFTVWDVTAHAWLQQE